MTHLNIGDNAPEISLPSDNDGNFDLSQQKGKKTVLYFYPKDDTPGCTKQACGFNDELSQLNNLNVDVIGISKCSVKKHNKFKEKYSLNFPLLSDENNDVCERYGVWVEKSMYGRKYMGIERTTVILDENNVITHIWSKVKVPGHVDAVINALSGA